LYKKLAEEKSTLELALETTRQQCDEQQRNNTNLTEEYERQHKMGSEPRTVRAIFTRFDCSDIASDARGTLLCDTNG
jgi:hypothetical protein